MVLYGRNSVFERLKKNPASIKRIFLQDNFKAPNSIEKLITANNIAVEYLSFRGLSRIKQADSLQGIIARVEEFKYASFNGLLSLPQDKQLTLIFLDRIYDPQNLGSIVRSAACFGGFAVIIPKFKACEVNETVLHVASGGENYVLVSRVSNLSNAIIAAKRHGYWIIGAEINQDADSINEASLPHPLAFVLGSEGEGIRYGVGKHLDLRVRIPMSTANFSLNVATACAIFCHEISKMRMPNVERIERVLLKKNN